ncbi:MAG: DUF6285 domain-containing protein [Acetobacteraceae bacterium]
MRDGADGVVLLAIARATLLEEILSGTRPEQMYTVRMIANAMAIAGRELALDRAAAEREAGRRMREAYRKAGIAEPAADLPLREMERCLARDLRAGLLDDREAAFLPLLEWQVRERLALANPKRLTNKAKDAP